MLNKMVTLICGEQKLKTTPKNAQDLLHIQKQMSLKGWELPDDSPYEFIDNALIKRADKTDCKGEKKSKATQGRRTAPGEAKVSHGDNIT